MTGSRLAGPSRDELQHQPLYARILGLRHLAPGGFLCFVFLEGAVALGILLALAELVSWWGVLVLPMMVAIMVKLNDVVAGLLIRPAADTRAVPTTPGRTMRSTSPGAFSDASPGAETVRLSPAVIVQVGSAPSVSDSPPLRPATVRPTGTGSGMGGEDRWGAPMMDASALNGPPVTRQWTEDLDDHQQRARQSAARRYE